MARQRTECKQYKVSIRKDLADLMESLLEDPRKPGNMGYGELRAYLERLIADDMYERQALSKEVLEDLKNELEK